MITLLKLGGSLITNKKTERAFRVKTVSRLAQEIKRACTERPGIRLIIGHGSGSFGHFAAKKHRTIQGVNSIEEWQGFAAVANAAAELNSLVMKELCHADLPVMRFQPSASVRADDGSIHSMNLDAIQKTLNHGIIPVVYGDVAIDDTRGGTITSTETIFAYLVKNLPVERLLLAGEVDGVYDETSSLIPEITHRTFKAIEPSLQGASGTDVTGGMYSKVQDMLTLTQVKPDIQIKIFNGTHPERTRQALLTQPVPCTSIYN